MLILTLLAEPIQETVNAGDTMIFTLSLQRELPTAILFKTILDSSYFELDHLALDSAPTFFYWVFAGTVPFDGPDEQTLKPRWIK